MNFLRSNPAVLAFLVGLLAVTGFAPFSLFPLPVFALAILFVQWLHAKDARAAARLGFVFGLGLYGAGASWIYIALHDYGDMPFPLALLADLLFAAVLAAFPAAAGYVQARLRMASWARVALTMPASWVLMEWLRGLTFTGFPWLTLGYSQVAASPLVGYAPLLGVYGVSLMLAVSAGLFALLFMARWSRDGKMAWALLATLWILGVALRTVEWTQPQGEPLKVSLVQGNIPQELKFHEEKLVETLETYRRLVQQSDARLIVLPETALPILHSELPENYVAILREHVRQNGGDIIIGAFETERGQYYNSVFTLGTAESQSYRKNHLVPFGEFIPWRSALGWFINEVLNIPMGDLARGGIAQPPLRVAGQKIAANICYEDVFGEEIVRALPEATLLVNVSNDAWYGNSNAAIQHNQISQMRALESGRMMLRATNTGVTSVIDRNGRIQQMLPQHEEGVLTAEVLGYTGSTPYVRWGNALMLGLIAVMLAMAWRLRRL
ncbi:MAG: apolipoprotein N-acyltransferase [Nitrosomonadales bacterium]|nr:apolipoprotein N-acyltransferase [Nitrosomonadales bacterium]